MELTVFIMVLLLFSMLNSFHLSGATVNASIKKNTIKILRRDLLEGYDNLARPVRNFSKTTIVKLSFFPMHVTELNEEQGIMITEGFLDMTWHDEHLFWEPNHYEGIKQVHFNQYEIWKPDISVFEGRGSEVDPLNDKVHLYVNNTGNVFWTPPTTIESVCQLDYSDYPYDTQKCMITFGSWVQDGKFVDLVFLYDYADMLLEDNSPTNPLWKMQKITLRRKEEVVPSTNGEGEDKFVALQYTLHLQRRIQLSQRVAVVPKTVAALLHLSMFWLPANSEKKIILGTSGLLLQTLTIIYIGISLPTAAAVYVALRSIQAELASGIAAIIFQIIIINVALVKSLNLPLFIKRLNNGFVAKVLCLCTVEPTILGSDTSELVEGPGTQNQESEWLLAATLCDRILFPVFALVFIILGSL